MSENRINVAQISGKQNSAGMTGELGAGALVVNDYRITTEPIDGGHRLTVKRGSEVQTMDLLDGKSGDDGKSSYIHIRYSTVENPETGDQMSDVPSDYIGIYVDDVDTDSSDPADYKWMRFKGEPGQPGQDAPQESVLYTPQALTTEQQAQARENVGAASAARVEAVEDALPGKLTEPAEGLAVGKYFRVAAIDENGHAVLEAVDAKDVGVQDVQVAGASVVENGVANVPLATNIIKGVASFDASMGISYQPNGVAYISAATKIHIDNRSQFKPITPSNFDYTLEAGMCDGKGAPWADPKRIAALLRLGCTVDDDGYVKWTAQEV